MPVAEKTKEQELRSELTALKQSLSAAENALNSESREKAAALKQAAKADEYQRQIASLETALADREKQLGQVQAEVSSLKAHQAKADQIIEDARGLKRLVDSV